MPVSGWDTGRLLSWFYQSLMEIAWLNCRSGQQVSVMRGGDSRTVSQLRSLFCKEVTGENKKDLTLAAGLSLVDIYSIEALSINC